MPKEQRSVAAGNTLIDNLVRGYEGFLTGT